MPHNGGDGAAVDLLQVRVVHLAHSARSDETYVEIFHIIFSFLQLEALCAQICRGIGDSLVDLREILRARLSELYLD